MDIKKTLPLSSSLKLALLAGAISMAMETPVYAEEEEKEVERIEVTGSRIKRIDIEGPSPVVVITAEDMEKQGYANVQDVLDGMVQNTGGSANQSFTFGFAPAAADVDLRGFGAGRTLVLIDGRRVPNYPIAQSGVSNFVNLAAIPQAMVERIDVLLDGASAIYGSDAISGVINVITKKDFDGGEASIRFGDTVDGGFENNRIQFALGTVGEKTSMSLIVEHWQNDPLWAEDREYAASDTANERGVYSIGGSTFVTFEPGPNGLIFTPVQDPNCGTASDAIGGLGIPNQNIPIFTDDDQWCAFNRTAFRQLYSEVKRDSANFRFEHEINDDVAFFGKTGFVHTETKASLEPNFYGGALFGPDNGTGGIVDAGAVNNPTVVRDNTGAVVDPGLPGVFVRRLVEFGPRTTHVDDVGISGLVGLSGVVADLWEWETGLQYSSQVVNTERPNIVASELNQAITDGLNLFERIPQSVIDQLVYNADRRAESTSMTWDFVLDGEFEDLQLMGGPVAFASIIEYQKEWFNDVSDPITLDGDAFDGATAGGGERKRYGGGVELFFPVLDNLGISAAARYDKYDDESDTDAAVSPKVSIEYRPIDTLLLRASWGESFRAPDMQRLFGGETRAFTRINDPYSGRQLPSVSFITSSNIELEEEEGTNITAGVVWEAIEDMTLKLDYYNIELENIVSSLGAQFIVNSCFNDATSSLCDFITFGPNGTLQGDASITSIPLNVAFQKISGFDVTWNYRLSTDKAGEFNFEVATTYIDSLESQISETEPVTENIGLASTPEMRYNLTAGWGYENFGTTLQYVWVDELCGNNATVEEGSDKCSSEDMVDSVGLLNWTFTYDFEEYGQALVGVNNVTNEDPPEDPTNDQWPWFFNAGGYYNPIGQEYFVQYKYSF